MQADGLHERAAAGGGDGAPAVAAAAGVQLRHHGDFDRGGLTIGNVLHRRCPIESWQFDCDAYLRAVALHPHAAPLTGLPTSASCDAEPTEAMRAAGRRIEEDLVARDLLEVLL